MRLGIDLPARGRKLVDDEVVILDSVIRNRSPRKGTETLLEGLEALFKIRLGIDLPARGRKLGGIFSSGVYHLMIRNRSPRKGTETRSQCDH